MSRAGLTGALAMLAATAACTTVPERSGMLSDYSRQAAFDGRLSKRAAARPQTPPPADAPIVFETVGYAPGVEARSGLTTSALDLVRNKFARDLCANLAEGFEVTDQPSDGVYRLRAFITEIRPTGRLAAAVSLPLNYLSPVGGRVPLGLGALSAEVELLDPDGVQVASMTWRRAASAADSGPSVSTISDAYQLAGEAADSFGQVMATQGGGALDAVRTTGLIGNIRLGGSVAECARYGEGPGLLTSAFELFGPSLPPEWVDQGPARTGIVSVSEPQGVDDDPGDSQTSANRPTEPE